MSLPELSIKRPVLATVMTAALVLLGIVSLFKLSIAEYPNMSYPYVSVQITYDGARPEQMDAQIVRKVEEAVSEAKGVRHITSTSTEGSADIGVEFAMEVDPAAATQEVRDKVNAIKDDLPQGINEPVVSRFDMNADPVAAIAITSDKLSQRELSILVEEQVKPAIQQIAGVGKLSVFGEEKREVQLLMRPESLRAFALAPAEVAENIEQGIKEVPGGNLDSGTAKLSVSTKSKIVRPQDFNNLMVAQRGGQPVYFRQIGEARDTIKDRTSAAHYDGVQAIGIEVGKQSGGNAVKVAAAVKEELTKLQKTLPDSVQVHLVRDDAQRIKDSMHGVYEDLVIGGIFAVFVVFLFLGDLRSTLISAVTIPTSLISTFFFMNQAGFSINTMTMLGLSLAIGLLIDDAHRGGGKYHPPPGAGGRSAGGSGVRYKRNRVGGYGYLFQCYCRIYAHGFYDWFRSGFLQGIRSDHQLCGIDFPVYFLYADADAGLEVPAARAAASGIYLGKTAAVQPFLRYIGPALWGTADEDSGPPSQENRLAGSGAFCCQSFPAEFYRHGYAAPQRQGAVHCQI